MNENTELKEQKLSETGKQILEKFEELSFVETETVYLKLTKAFAKKYRKAFDKMKELM